MGGKEPSSELSTELLAVALEARLDGRCDELVVVARRRFVGAVGGEGSAAGSIEMSPEVSSTGRFFAFAVERRVLTILTVVLEVKT